MIKKHTFQELSEITENVIREFERAEQRSWGVEGTMIELSKQLGDLAKHIMVSEKYYVPKRGKNPNYATTKEDIADELADIFYCIIRLAKAHDIDLEEAILKARKSELLYLGKKPNF